MSLQAAILSRAAGLDERKVVSMLFADLTASTEIAARLDPEDLRAVLHPFFDAMVDEIARYGGTVEKLIGDAVVAVFARPWRMRMSIRRESPRLLRRTPRWLSGRCNSRMERYRLVGQSFRHLRDRQLP
jgi:class 3 adenylate cyclase